MRKYFLLLLLIGLWSGVFAQSASLKQSGYFTRVNDTTTYQAAAATAHSQGYSDIYYNNQATTKHFDIWNGSSYDHVFDFNAGGGSTPTLQEVMTQSSILSGDNTVASDGIVHIGTGPGMTDAASFNLDPTGDIDFNATDLLNWTFGRLTINGSSGTSGQVLTSTGSGSAPTWQTPSGGGSQDFQDVMDNGSSANIGDASADLTAQDGSNYSQWAISPNTAEIANSNNANTQNASINLSPSGLQINDTWQNRGIQGQADYSANIQANDFTQKVYVDAGLATKQGTLTNSAGLRSALSDESGTGVALFAGTSGSNIANTAAGNISATDVQAAINELDGEKALLTPATRTVTTSTTAVAADAGGSIEMNSASSTTVTIPPASTTDFSDNTIITIKNYNSGTVTLTAGSGVTFRQQTGGGLTIPQFGIAQVQNKTGDEWYVWNGTIASISASLVQGTSTNDNSTAGYLSEYVESKVASGSAVSLTTATSANITSISLTAGDWDVTGNVNYIGTTATITGKVSGISSTSATVPTDGTEIYSGVTVTASSNTDGTTLSTKRFSLSATTIVYLVGQATFSAGTVTAYGYISARRAR